MSAQKVDTIETWESECLAVIHSGKLRSDTSHSKKLSAFIEQLATKQVLTDFAEETPQFLNVFLPSVVSAVLEIDYIRSETWADNYASILRKIALLIPVFVDRDEYHLFLEGASQLCINQTAPFYLVTTPSRSARSKYIYTICRAIANSMFLEKLQQIFARTDLSVERFHLVIRILGVVGGLYPDRQSIAGTVVEGVACWMGILKRMNGKELRQLDEQTLKCILNGFANIRVLYKNDPVSMELLNAILFTGVKLVDSEYLEKQFRGLEILRNEILMGQKEDHFAACGHLRDHHFPQIVLTDKLHMDLVADVIDILDVMIRYDLVDDEDIKKLWSISVHQHASIVSRFLNGIERIIQGKPKVMSIIISGILEEDVFTVPILDFLTYLSRNFPKQLPQKQFFDVLSRHFCSSEGLDEITKSRLMETICHFLPTEASEKAELQEECMKMIEANSVEYALPILQALIEKVSPNEAKSLFDMVIGIIGRESLNPIKYFRLLTTILSNFGSQTLSNDEFQALMSITKPLFESNSQSVCDFYYSVLGARKVFQLDSLYNLFTMVCSFESMTTSEFRLFKSLFMAMNVGDDLRNGVAIDQVWNCLYRTGNADVAKFLVQIYGDNCDSKSIQQFFGFCLKQLDCPGSLLAIQKFLQNMQFSLNSSVQPNGFYVRQTTQQFYHSMCVRRESTFDFLSDENSNKLFELLSSDNDALASCALDVLNQFPTLRKVEQDLESTTPQWDKTFSIEKQFLFLYYVHAVGSKLKNNAPHFSEIFFGTGGADAYLAQMLKLCANQSDPGDKFGVVFDVAVLVVQQPEWGESEHNVNGYELIDQFVSSIDEDIGYKYLFLARHLFDEAMAKHPKLHDLVKLSLFSQMSKLRHEALEFVRLFALEERRDLLVSVLDSAMETDTSSDTYFEFLIEVSRETTDVNSLWLSVQNVLFKYFSLPPPDDVIGRLLFRTVDPARARSIFAILNILFHRKEDIDDPRELFWFLINNIVFNEVKYYPIGKDLYDLLISLFEACPDVGNKFMPMIAEVEKMIGFDDNDVRLSSSGQCRGIRNLGCTCYINASIQQLYNVKEFRDAILAASCDDSDWFPEFQYIFGKLLCFPTSYISISNYVKQWKGWDGEPINVMQQQDAGEFLQVLLERIDGLAPDASKMFKGKFKHVVSSPANVSVKTESYEEFLTLSLEVKGQQNMKDSFRVFLAPDHFEEYNFGDAGKLEAFRHTKIVEAPEILIIQLKRFEYNLALQTREKVNDRFEFPSELDIAPIKEDASEPELFDLIGIVVHSGSAESGHYFSHAKTDDGWYTFNDIQVTQCDIRMTLENCAGGPTEIIQFDDGETAEIEGSSSAYLLFYQKRPATFSGDETRVDVLGDSLLTQSGKLLNQKLLERLLLEIKGILWKSVLKSDGFCSFVAKTCHEFPEFLYEFACKGFEFEGITNVLTELQAMMTENSAVSDLILRDETNLLNLVLFHESKRVRESYLALVTHAIEYATDEGRNALKETVTKQLQSSKFMSRWRSFEEFFKMTLALVNTGCWDDNWYEMLLHMVQITLKEHSDIYPDEKIYSNINLSTIFTLLTKLWTPQKQGVANLVNDTILANVMTGTTSVTSFQELILETRSVTEQAIENFIVRMKKGPLSSRLVAFYFVVALQTGSPLISRVMKETHAYLGKNMKHESQVFWRFCTELTTTNCPSMCTSFIGHCEPFLRTYLFARAPEIEAFVTFLGTLIDRDPDLGKEALRSLLGKTFNLIVLLISRVCDEDYATSPMHAVVSWYFVFVERVCRKGESVGPVIAMAGILTDAMQSFGQCHSELPRECCFRFIASLMDDNQAMCDTFFEHASYEKFLQGFDNYSFREENDRVMIMHTIMNIMPTGGAGDLFRSLFFRRYCCWCFRHDPVASHEMRDFVIKHLSSTNVKRMLEFLLNEEVYRAVVIGSDIAVDILTTIFSRYPKMSQYAYEETSFKMIWKAICQLVKKYEMYHEIEVIAPMKAHATVLAAFNRSYTKENKGAKSLLRGNFVESIAKWYMDKNMVVHLTSLFQCCLIDGNCVYDDGICKLLVSLAKMYDPICNFLYKYIRETEVPIYHRAVRSTSRFIPTMVAKIVKTYLARDAQRNDNSADLIVREVVAAKNAHNLSQIVNYPCKVLATMTDSTDDETLQSVVEVLGARISDVFGGGISDFLVSVATAQLSQPWIDAAVQVIAKSITTEYSSDTALEEAARRISMYFRFLEKLCLKMSMEIPVVEVGNDEKLALATQMEKLATEETSNCAEILVRLVT